MPGLSVTALCVPAREVGGDYYDFLPLDDHRLGVLIADVSGKGTSAALYMAELKGLMLSLSQIHTSPRELLIAANRIIAEQPRRAQLHHDDLRGHRPARADDDVRARGPHAAHVRAGRRRRRPTARAAILAPDGLVLGLKIDSGEMFERLLEEETIPLHDGRSLSVLHRRHQRGDERGGRLLRRDAARAARRGARATCRPTSCASACCARSRRSSATRRSTTT